MDETWEKWFFDLENDECHLSWKGTHSSYSDVTTQSTCALTAVAAAANNNTMENSSLEENSGFDDNTTSLKKHASSEKPMLSSSMSYILSFEDFTAVPNNSPMETCRNQPKEAQKEVDNRKSKGGRSSSQIADHVIAERKRRENLTKMFITLSAIIPGLNKMDKASIIGNTIDYVKYLQKRVKDFEEQCKKRKIESVVCFKKDKSDGFFVDDSSCTSDGLQLHRPIKTFPNIVNASVSAKDVLVKIMCGKRKNIITTLLAKLETHNLSIVCSNVLPFGSSILIITIIAQVDHELNMTMDDLVKNLNEDLLECCTLQQ